jgi:hypothetical protein
MNVPKYYYNLNRCINDGKTQFDTTNMPKETYEVNGQIYHGSNDLMDLLNALHEENIQLKERNDRQAKRLGELYELIAKKDWESLTEIIDDFKRCEEQLQREWKCYDD